MSDKLTEYESWVIHKKGTEKPHSGLYAHHTGKGTYHCKACDAPLYRSDDKFDSRCGWPSFDDEIVGAVKRLPDADGRRVEILCQACGGHLGHVFHGEGFTEKDTRHCVNSVSIVFKRDEAVALSQAVFASGCFWGTQYFMARIAGVVHTDVGYTGGEVENPTYEQVCQGKTGHLEALLVYYDKAKVSYQELVRVFFETHNFSQQDGQGPDIGPQYLSAVFVSDDEEKKIVQGLIGELEAMGQKVATTVRPRDKFYVGEDYHQNYYESKGGTPYCHTYRQIFDR